MKRIALPFLFVLSAATCARADTALMIPAIYGCLADFGNGVSIPNPPAKIAAFTLNGVSGQATLQSQVPSYWDEHYPPSGNETKLYNFSYKLDLSTLPAAPNHCVKLMIHFGGPAGCFGPGVEGNPAQFQSASLGPFGDISFVFAGGCLQPGQSAVSFLMVTEASYKTGVVTVIDDYVDAASGLTNETRLSVPAIVPDIAPDPPPWVIAYYYSRIQPVLFQGNLDLVGTNQTNTNFPVHANGPYDFTLQLVTGATNGPVISQTTTQTVQVVNGVFQVPLPGDAASFISGTPSWLLPAVRPSGNGPFTPLNPPLPIAPTPQAFYAYTAGTVADLAPGQAVTSLNGLSDAVNLQAGSGIALGTNGNTLTISSPGTPSDRNIKTDFAPVSSESILASLAALPISSWRYTNEVAGVRHVGPMAQDFKAAFGLGNSDKIIGFVDVEGVSLAAIQALNRKLDEKDAAIQKLEQENAALEKRLDNLQQIIKAIAPPSPRPGD